MKPGEELDGESEEEEGKWTASIVADFDQHKWDAFKFILELAILILFCFTLDRLWGGLSGISRGEFVYQKHILFGFLILSF